MQTLQITQITEAITEAITITTALKIFGGCSTAPVALYPRPAHDELWMWLVGSNTAA